MDLFGPALEALKARNLLILWLRVPASDRERIAERMSALIGLPSSYIAKANLRVTEDMFVEELLKNQNLVLGRLDTRVTAPPFPRFRKIVLPRPMIHRSGSE